METRVGQKHLKPGDARIGRLYNQKLMLVIINRHAYSTSLQNNKFITTIEPGDARIGRLYNQKLMLL